jgi:hypothetical protein
MDYYYYFFLKLFHSSLLLTRGCREKGSTGKARIYIHMLSMFAALAQAKLPYRIANGTARRTVTVRDTVIETDADTLTD